MKNGKGNFGFSYIKNMENFEAFLYTINLTSHPEFLKSEMLFTINGTLKSLLQYKLQYLSTLENN